MIARGDHLRAANPAAESYQDYQVLVGVRLHRGFHFVLRRFQFFLERVPFVVLGKFVDAIAAAEQLSRLLRALLPSLMMSDADILHLLAVLRFHGDEAVRDQTAEVEGDLRAIP